MLHWCFNMNHFNCGVSFGFPRFSSNSCTEAISSSLESLLLCVLFVLGKNHSVVLLAGSSFSGLPAKAQVLLHFSIKSWNLLDWNLIYMQTTVSRTPVLCDVAVMWPRAFICRSACLLVHPLLPILPERISTLGPAALFLFASIHYIHSFI